MPGLTTVYLNNAAGSWPKAPGVAEAVQRALEAMPAEPGRTSACHAACPDRCRALLAELLGVSSPERIALTAGATFSLNIAVLGLAERQPLRVVTTIAEHNSLLRPLRRLESLGTADVRLVGLDNSGALDTRAALRNIEEGCDVFAATHASNVTGRVFDVAPLFRAARAAGAVTLLDASQTLGIVPVRPMEMSADIVAFTGHKGLLGPPGCGGLWVREGLELAQVFVGGTGVLSEMELHPPHMPMRLEAGTPGLPAIAGLQTALEWLRDSGASFAEQALQAGRALREGLSLIPGVTLYGCAPEDECVPVVSFRVDGWAVDETGYALTESFGVACRTGLHCAPEIHRRLGSLPEGTVRFSASGWTSGADIQRALSAVRALSAARAARERAA